MIARHDDTVAATDIASSRLFRMARRRLPRASSSPNAAGASSSIDVHGMHHGTSATPTATAPVEACGLCSAVVPDEHRHLLDLAARRLVCACRACALLFDGGGSIAQQYRLIPVGARQLHDVDGADQFWAELSIPVGLAFFFRDTVAKRVVALYPGALGVAESQLPMTAWETLVHDNPEIGTLRPDVEALLVNRTRGMQQHWLVPIDTCYALAGIIRTHWKGLGGGDAVWSELDRFFTDLESRPLRDGGSDIS